MKNWFKDETFWTVLYDSLFPKKSFIEAEQQTDQIIELCGFDRANQANHSGAMVNSNSNVRVLDLCCGPGRFSIPMAKRGFNVTGVDLQPSLLQKAKNYAKQENLKINFIQDDMRTFRESDSFDLIVNLWSSFGYFENQDDDVKVLENAFDSLKKHGKLMIDVRGKEIHAMKNQHSHCDRMDNGDLVLQHSSIINHWTATLHEWFYIHEQQVLKFKMIFNLYSARELELLLKKVGFRNIRFFGGICGRAYDQQASRLVILAQK